jgi:ankyrin repeat protein
MKQSILYSMVLIVSFASMHGASENIDEKVLAKKMIAKQLSDGFEANDIQALKKLFDENPKVLRTRLKKDNNTLLHLAVIRDRPDILALLFSYEGVSANKKNFFGNTPAHLAATFGNVRCARILVQYGANLTIKNNLNATPMDYIRAPHFFNL